MTDNENIKALDNLHDRILNDKSFLAKVNHGELSALFHVKRILELQKAEIERLNLENLQMVASIKRLKSEAIKEFWEKVRKYIKQEICFFTPDDEHELEMFGDNLVKEITEGKE